MDLVGHGLRERQILGPLEPEQEPVPRTIRVRRYLCRGCGATCTVGPRGLVAFRHYAAVAITWALALWARSELPASEVRELVSPFRCVGATAAAGWSSLLRWGERLVAAWGAGFGSRRSRVGQALSRLASCSPLSASEAGFTQRLLAAVAQGAWCPSG